MNYSIILAGGEGRRLCTEGLPKQLVQISGKSIICHTLSAFEKCEAVDGVVIVSNPKFLEDTRSAVAREGFCKVVDVVPGGANFWDSVECGLKYLEEELELLPVDAVTLHGASCPLVTPEILSESIAGAAEHGASAASPPNTISTWPVVTEVRDASDLDGVEKACKMQADVSGAELVSGAKLVSDADAASGAELVYDIELASDGVSSLDAECVDDIDQAPDGVSSPEAECGQAPKAQSCQKQTASKCDPCNAQNDSKFATRYAKRNTYAQVQFPFSFKLPALQDSLKKMKNADFVPGDHPVFHAGYKFFLTKGAYENIKITTKDELEFAKRLLS